MDDDLVLVERFQAGEKAAFDVLMQRHYRAVLNLVYRFTGCSGQAAEDMAQEVFFRVLRALPRFEARARFFTYLYKVTMNLCFKERAKESRKRSRVVSLDGNWNDPNGGVAPVVPDPSGSAYDGFARTEVAEEVRSAVMSLAPEQREAVVLYRFEHRSYEEIGDILGITLPAVKSRLHRAKLVLQKKLGATATARRASKGEAEDGRE